MLQSNELVGMLTRKALVNGFMRPIPTCRWRMRWRRHFPRRSAEMAEGDIVPGCRTAPVTRSLLCVMDSCLGS